MTANWEGAPKTWVTDEEPPFQLLNREIRDRFDFLKQLATDAGAPNFLKTSRTTSDFVKNADTTLADVTGLSFSVAAGEIWVFVSTIHYSASTTADMKFGLVVPSGAFGGRWGILTRTNPVTEDDDLISNQIDAQGFGTTDVQPAIIYGTVFIASTAGDVKIQAAQNASHATDATIYTNSTMLAIKLN